MEANYTYSLDGEYYYNSGFNSRSEAIAEASASFPDMDIFYTGVCVVPDRIVNAYRVIDDVLDATTEEAGEWAEGYLQGVTSEQVSELQEMLQKAWNEWEAKHDLAPKWYNVEDVQRHDLTQEEKA